jgi:4-hydroxy-tetrahydrodipicolinate synthase
MEKTMFKPEGVYVAMLTSFKQDGRIHEQEMRKMVDFQIQKGVNGLFPVSSVGEYIHMSREEKVTLMEIVHDQAKGRVPITPGVGSSHPEEAIFLAEKAKAIGCDGVVIAPPYFFPLSQTMIEQYFETIIHAVDIPVILYNIPLFTQPLNYDTVRRLARKPNVAAMKDSSGSMVDFLHFMDSVRLEKGEMHFLTGREEMLLSCLMMGGKGCMTATAGILPEVMVEIYQCFLSGDYERARELQFSILPVIRTMFSLPFPLGFKIAIEMRGFNMGPPKQPLSHKNASQLNEIKLSLEQLLQPIMKGLEKR